MSLSHILANFVRAAHFSLFLSFREANETEEEAIAIAAAAAATQIRPRLPRTRGLALALILLINLCFLLIPRLD